MSVLRVGDVLTLYRIGGKPGTKAAEHGRPYTIRQRVVDFMDADGALEVELQRQTPILVILERLDDNARSQPPGSLSSRSLHSVWWLLNGGGYELEPQRCGHVDDPTYNGRWCGYCNPEFGGDRGAQR